jgi:hypothetical protein
MCTPGVCDCVSRGILIPDVKKGLYIDIAFGFAN